MQSNDQFFAWIGKTMALFSVLFVVVFAVLCAVILIDEYEKSRTEPTFTIAPDSARRGK